MVQSNNMFKLILVNSTVTIRIPGNLDSAFQINIVEICKTLQSKKLFFFAYFGISDSNSLLQRIRDRAQAAANGKCLHDRG